jgi:hypothetical protein
MRKKFPHVSHHKLIESDMADMCKSIYGGPAKKLHGSSPFTPPSSCYTHPYSILPYNPIQSSNQSVHRNIGSDNHTITFASDKSFVLVGTEQWKMERYRKEESSSTVIPTIHGLGIREFHFDNYIIGTKSLIKTCLITN